MSNSTFAHLSDATCSLGRPRALETILYGGLVVGALDALDAMIFFGLWNSSSPKGIFQYIASALLGRASFSGGFATILLGVLLHFLIATILTAIYYCASLYLPMLIRRALVWGPIYGVAAHFVMNFVVTPLSAAPKTRYSVPVMLNGVIGHALLIGLPIALITRWSARRNAGQ